jgi:hypothetical protein
LTKISLLLPSAAIDFYQAFVALDLVAGLPLGFLECLVIAAGMALCARIPSPFVMYGAADISDDLALTSLILPVCKPVL